MVGIIATIAYIFTVINIGPVLSNEEIANKVDKIEEINRETFDIVKLKYNIISRDDVDFKYGFEDEIVRVNDSSYYQSFNIDNSPRITDKEINEEIDNFSSSYDFIDYNKTLRNSKSVIKVLGIVPLFIFIFALVVHGLNKQNIEILNERKALAENNN